MRLVQFHDYLVITGWKDLNTCFNSPYIISIGEQKMIGEKIGTSVAVGTYTNMDNDDTGVFASPLDDIPDVYETCMQHDDDPIEVVGYSRGVYLAPNLEELSLRIIDKMGLRDSSLALHPAQLGYHSTVKDDGWDNERTTYLMDALPREQFDKLYELVNDVLQH